MDEKFFESTSKTSFVFNTKKKVRRLGKDKTATIKQHFIKLSFFLINHLFEEIKRAQNMGQDPSLLLPSKDKEGSPSSKKVFEMIKHDHVSLSKQDWHTLLYEELVSRYHLSIKEVSLWRLHAGACASKKIHFLAKSKKVKYPNALKTHHVFPLVKGKKKEETGSDRYIEEENKRRQEQWRLWRHGGDGDSSRVSPV